MRITDRPKHEQSPFHQGNMDTLGLRKFPLHPSGPMVNKDTGEIVTGNVYLHKKYGYMDTLDNVKLFQQAAETLSQLTIPGIRMFFYIVSSLHKGEEKVYIAPQSALKFTSYKSNKDIYKGLAELIEFNVIARSTESLMYWVNPNVIFAGNKVGLINTENDE